MEITIRGEQLEDKGFGGGKSVEAGSIIIDLDGEETILAINAGEQIWIEKHNHDNPFSSSKVVLVLRGLSAGSKLSFGEKVT